MMWCRRTAVSLSLCLAFAGVGSLKIEAQSTPDMHWRMIGPFRGGRTRAAVGVPGEPNVFYVGQVDGGVWKSTDYGRTWEPIFDGAGVSVDWCDCGCAVEREHCVCGERGRAASAGSVRGRWDLPVGGFG